MTPLEATESARTVTMTIGHFSWVVALAVFVGTCIGMFALAAVHASRHGDDQ